MSNQYGPWATPIGACGNPQLSAFWRQRLTKLVPTSQSSPVLSRRHLLCLGAAGAMTAFLPTLRSTTAADEEKPAGQGTKPSSGRLFFQGAVKRKGDDAVQSGIFAVDPETGRCETIIKDGGGYSVSPDGKSLAYDKPTLATAAASLSEIWTYDLATQATVRILDDGKNVFPATDERAAKRKIFSGHPIWSPDGKQIVASVCRWNEDPNKPSQHIIRRVNRDGSGLTKLPIPEIDEVDDWSSDGKWFVTASDCDPSPQVGYQICRIHPDGSEQLQLTKGARNCYPRFSPDGRQIVYHRDYWMLHRYEFELHVMDVDGTNDHVVLRNEELANFESACWSPDGRHLAVVWYTEILGKDGVKSRWLGEQSKHRIEIMDADGKNRRVVKLSDAIPHYICCLDWR
jgi:Tol biopolymer transport system component